jgi:hypothetical protein
VYYRADDAEYSAEPMVTLAALRECRKGNPFSRVLEMEVASIKSVLDLGMDGLAGQELLSNCPYRLLELVKDQGLDCVFGRKDHQVKSSEPIDSEQGLSLAIDRLRETLERVVLSSKSTDT